MSESSLIILERAAIMLAEADTIQKAKELKNLALTAADWARRKGMGEAAIQHCRSYALEAERKMGEMLAATERNPGVRVKGGSKLSGGNVVVPPENKPTLAQIGVTKNESAQAQALAAVPRKAFDAVISGQQSRAKAVGEVRVTERRKKLRTMKWPEGKFRVIYADPPWPYNDKRLGDKGAGKAGGGTGGTYDTMTLEAICEMKVRDLSLPQSVCFLWITSPLLPDGLKVMDSWGFQYKASFVWDKVRGFNGHYNDVRHEFLLIGTRGSCTPEISTLPDSVVVIEKDRHSRKPIEFTHLIDSLYPSGPRVELFARSKQTGWTAWGNQLE